MPESIDVVADAQAFASEYNALRDDALRMLLAQGIGDSETLISTGALTISSDNIGFVTVGAESGVEDQLDTMTVASLDDGDLVVLMATAGDEITIADSASTDGFSLDGEDVVLSGETLAGFIHKGTTWYLVFCQRVPIGSINFTLGTGAAVVADGTSAGGRIPYGCELIRISIIAPYGSGTIRVEFWMEDHATAPPVAADEIGSISLSSAQKGEDVALSGFTTTRLIKDEWLMAYVDGVATSITQVLVEMHYMRIGH